MMSSEPQNFGDLEVHEKDVWFTQPPSEAGGSVKRHHTDYIALKDIRALLQRKIDELHAGTHDDYMIDCLKDLGKDIL